MELRGRRGLAWSPVPTGPPAGDLSPAVQPRLLSKPLGTLSWEPAPMTSRCEAHALHRQEVRRLEVPWDEQCLPLHPRTVPNQENTCYSEGALSPNRDPSLDTYPTQMRADVGVRSWAWGRGGREGVHPGHGGQPWLNDGFPLPGTMTGLCRTAFQMCPRPHT